VLETRLEAGVGPSDGRAHRSEYEYHRSACNCAPEFALHDHDTTEQTALAESRGGIVRTKPGSMGRTEKKEGQKRSQANAKSSAKRALKLVEQGLEFFRGATQAGC
jgi:hypothetical protein